MEHVKDIFAERQQLRESRFAEQNAQSNASIKAYWDRVRQQDDEREQGSTEWFARQLGATTYKPLRLPYSQEQIEQYLTMAYSRQVENVGMIPLLDTDTQRTLADVSRWLATHVKNGLLLQGYIGTGKTTMLYAIADVIRICLPQKFLTILTATDIVAKMSDKDKATTYTDALQTPLLGIDDLGTEQQVVKSYGNETTPMVDLLTRRYEKRQFTIITTNLTNEEIKSNYGERIADRLKEQYNVIRYSTSQPSYRQ